MTFQIDEEATIEAMAYAGNVDLSTGQATLYVIFCAGSDEQPHVSHGGAAGLDANEVIQAAKEANEAPGKCHYLAAAVGIIPEDLFHLANLTADFLHGTEDGPDDLG